MELIIVPDHGVAPILAAIARARKSVELVVFRFDHRDIEAALKEAAARGVRVTALIAYTNHGGEELLRKLESRLLEGGVIVARTADDLVRYHGKFLIIDRRELLVLSYNFTHLDIEHSRGFGIATGHAQTVREAVRLFEADCTRSAYSPTSATLVVSPGNSRRVLGEFLARAKKQLLIFDPKIADRKMVALLEERAMAGVDVRIIGGVNPRAKLSCRRQTYLRLHTRTVIRDQRWAFVGSQSLRRVQLDSRREVGLIVREAGIVRKLVEIFEAEWVAMDPTERQDKSGAGVEGAPTKANRSDADLAVQVVVQQLEPLAETVKDAVKKVVSDAGQEALQDDEVKHTVKQVVTKALKEAVKQVVDDAHEESRKP